LVSGQPDLHLVSDIPRDFGGRITPVDPALAGRECPELELALAGGEQVALDALLPAESPRLDGESEIHTRLLQERLEQFPPIVVNRRSMRVIDGMHRLSAARLQGAEKIQAVFVDLDDREAFLLAVKANITHGLPLSLADRESAAARILAWYPGWSDRAIAGVVGLAPKTVGAIRSRSSEQIPQLNARMGLDGRVRPTSTSEARRRACEILTDRPETSLREVAREAGLSLGTVYDVRERMRQGRDPVPDGQFARRRNKLPRRGRRARGGESAAWSSVRQRLVKDPTVRYADSGKTFMRWFDSRAIDCGEWRKLIDSIPVHWVDTMAGVASSCGDEWHEFARELERRRAEMA
jgi:ParB-like chromosome segregation protein Spo0J